MEKLAILSHVLYNESILDKTNELNLYNVKQITMSILDYEKKSKILLEKLKKLTFDYIKNTEQLRNDINDRIHIVFTTEYHNKMVNIFKQFNPDIKYSKLLDTMATIMFNCIRVTCLNFALLWYYDYTRRMTPFYTILEESLFNIVKSQMICMKQTYFNLI